MTETHGYVCEQSRARLRTTFEAIIGRGKRHALLDYPDTSNFGDHAIWLGEKLLFAEAGIAPVYECSMKDYDRAALADAIGDGVIWMHGGGNFGDLYAYHAFRLRVLQDFLAHEVILFPQTVMFYTDEAMRISAESIAAHGKVTLCARDALSWHILTRHFGANARILMAPDMAFLLNGMARIGSRPFEILWIHRSDNEAVFSARGIASATGFREMRHVQAPLDVLGDEIAMVLNGDIAGRTLLVSDWLRCQFMNGEAAAAFGRLQFDARSRACLALATRVLSLGKVVITDRLHGHILCTQLGIPHVLLNNSYGKNFAYYETWSRPLALCRLARSPAEAWALANELLKNI